MVCTSVKEGMDCFFMEKSGCQFNGGTCHQIIDECIGCQKIQEYPTGKYCQSFPDPAIKWRAGICTMATHKKVSNGNGNGKLNPLKASKRGAN
jgi:hypothetical protein